MNTVLYIIALVIASASAWDLPTAKYIGVLVGVLTAFVAGWLHG